MNKEWICVGLICIALAVLSWALSGCMTIRTDAGADENGHPFMRQVVSGKAKAVIEASRQSMDGTIKKIDPETGIILDIDFVSGQEAEGLQVDGLDAIVDLFSKTLAQMIRATTP